MRRAPPSPPGREGGAISSHKAPMGGGISRAASTKKLILTSYRHEMSINFYRIMKGIWHLAKPKVMIYLIERLGESQRERSVIALSFAKHQTSCFILQVYNNTPV